MPKQLKPKRKHITTSMIIASSNFFRIGIHIIIDRANINKLTPIYSNE